MGRDMYLIQVAHRILHPQLLGQEPIARVLVEGGRTLEAYGGISEAKTFAWALDLALDHVSEIFKERGIQLTKPRVELGEDSLDSYNNLRNALDWVFGTAVVCDLTDVEVSYFTDKSHTPIPRDHHKREIGNRFEKHGITINFEVIPCFRPYDRHPFNHWLPQKVNSLLLFLPGYRNRKVAATERTDVRWQRRLKRWGLRIPGL